MQCLADNLQTTAKHNFFNFSKKMALLPKGLCYDSVCMNLLFCSIQFSREEKMAIIVDVASIGTALGAVLFALWMLKQLFTEK